LLIGCDQQQTLGVGLGELQTVEGIPMQKQERSKAGCTLKSGWPWACLITSSQRLATLNTGV
jgi:hypothetical protein